jgi:hypothetical protein
MIDFTMGAAGLKQEVAAGLPWLPRRGLRFLVTTVRGGFKVRGFLQKSQNFG